MGEYNRQNLVYEKKDLLVDGPGKYPDYNFWRVAGVAIGGKDKGQAENEARAESIFTVCCPEREIMLIAFYIAAAVAVLATIVAITRHHAVHALLYLIVSLLAIAVVFYVVGAPFLAALELIIYAGAIMVLFLFVIMMLNVGEHATEVETTWLQPVVWAWPSALATILIVELIYVAVADARVQPDRCTS